MAHPQDRSGTTDASQDHLMSDNTVTSRAADPVAAAKRKRLNQDGAAILEDFLRQHGCHVSPAQISHLLVKVQKAGNPHCDASKIKQWFARRKNKNKFEEHVASLSGANNSESGNHDTASSQQSSRRTHLTSNQIALLKGMSDLLPNPTQDDIGLWANGLNVEESVVEGWLRDQRRVASTVGYSRTGLSPSASPSLPNQTRKLSMHIETRNIDPTGRLPTPADSVSSPRLPNSPYLNLETKLFLEQQHVLSPRSSFSLASPVAPHPSLPQSPLLFSQASHVQRSNPIAPPQSRIDLTLKAIIEGVKEAMNLPPDTDKSTLPRSRAEFESFMASYEPTLAKLQRALEKQ